MLSSTVLNLVMQGVIMLSVVEPKCDTQNNTMLRTIMLSVVCGKCVKPIMLSVVILNVVMLIVVLPIALYGGPLS